MTTSAVYTPTAVVVWALVLARVRMLHRAASDRSLWWALCALACAHTLQIHPVYASIDALVGVAGGAAILKHALALVAAAQVLALVRRVTKATASMRSLLLLGAASLVVMLLPLLVDRCAVVPAPLHGRAEYYSSSWAWLAHWGAFLAYLAWALLSGAHLTFGYGQQAGPSPVRTGLRLLTLGMGVGTAYVVLKVVVLGLTVLTMAGLTSSVVRADVVIEAVVLGCSVTLIAVGSGYAALVRRAEALVQVVTMRLSLQRLRPLWKALCTAVPTIALAPDTLTALLGPVKFSV